MSATAPGHRHGSPSLRRRLLLGLLGLVCGVWVVVTGWVYHVSRSEIDALLDAQLSQTARLMMSILEHEIAEGSIDRQAIAEIETFVYEYERVVDIWIWNAEGEQILWPANLGPLSANDSVSGFSVTHIRDESWRAFAYTDPKTGFRVQVAERSAVREHLGKSITSNAGMVMVGALPLIAAGMWFGVGRALRPLSRVSHEVAQRTPRDLRPLDDTDVPVEVRPVVRALNGLLDRMGQALDSEHRFTGDAAHELRTPLAGLRTQLQVALRARDPDQRTRALNQIVASVDRMTHLVNQLLTLARADSEDRATAAEMVDLPDLVTETVAELWDYARARQIDLHVEPTLEHPAFEGNRESVRIMIRNLVDNAIRYTPRGGQVKVSQSGEADAVILRVTDTGPGIAREERDRVLERFHRLAHNDTSGSGLGLSIVQRLAQLQGARLALEEGPGGRGLMVILSFRKPYVGCAE